MKTLTISIVAVVVVAVLVALGAPGGTAGAVLALGAPFSLFANVMAGEPADTRRTHEPQGSNALLVDCV